MMNSLLHYAMYRMHCLMCKHTKYTYNIPYFTYLVIVLGEDHDYFSYKAATQQKQQILKTTTTATTTKQTTTRNKLQYYTKWIKMVKIQIRCSFAHAQTQRGCCKQVEVMSV